MGLSRSVLVVEAAIRSGAMSTAHAAADENRDLYAVPGPIDSETSQGTHWLLKQGARLGDNPRELLDSFWDGNRAPAPGRPKKRNRTCSGKFPRKNRNGPEPCTGGSKNIGPSLWKTWPVRFPGPWRCSAPCSWNWSWGAGSGETAEIVILHFRRRKS